MKQDEKIIDLELKELIIEEQEKIVVESSMIMIGIIVGVFFLIGCLTRAT